jgi:hypothetical protein
MTVLRVAVTAIGVLLCVFLPEEVLCHAFAAEFLMRKLPVSQAFQSVWFFGYRRVDRSLTSSN